VRAAFSKHRHVSPLTIIVSPVLRLRLKSLHRFASTATAVEEITAMQEGKLGKGLKEFLNKVIVEKGKNKEELVVVDPKLGASPVSSCFGIHAN
jgi:nucleolar protein 58